MTGSGVAVDVGSDSILVSGIITVNAAGADNTGSNDNSDSSNSTNSNIYFENGTCKCPNATVGDTAVINGTTYTAVNNSTIVGQISAGNYNLCTTLVTDMSELFKNNSSFNSNISFWDVSNVTSMKQMFNDASAFNQDLSSWDTSKTTTMYGMFDNARAFNGNIGSWDSSSVTDMRIMFRNARVFNQDIGCLLYTSDAADE